MKIARTTFDVYLKSENIFEVEFNLDGDPLDLSQYEDIRVVVFSRNDATRVRDDVPFTVSGNKVRTELTAQESRDLFSSPNNAIEYRFYTSEDNFEVRFVAGIRTSNAYQGNINQTGALVSITEQSTTVEITTPTGRQGEQGPQGPQGEQGEQGETGNGIDSIELIDTVGLENTYRITFTDGSTFDYTVTDGEQGEEGNGIDNIALIDTVGLEKTYRITFTDSTTFDFVVTDGADAENGLESINTQDELTELEGTENLGLQDDQGDVKRVTTVNFANEVFNLATDYRARAAIGIEPAYTITVKTDNAGASDDDQVILNAVGDYRVEAYQNGSIVQSYSGLSGNETITLPSAGTYDLRIVPVGGTPFNRITWFGSGDELKLLKVLALGKNVLWSSFLNKYKNCTNLTSLVSGLTTTSGVTTMRAMLQNCTSVLSIDLSNINTINVTDMREVFNDCHSITYLDLSNFITTNVTMMDVMFRDCISLESINISNFNTENVTNMSQMFHTCPSLKLIDVSNFNTANVTLMIRMFQATTGNILGVESFNVGALTGASNMFLSNTLLTATYDQLLINWRAQNPNNDVPFHGGDSQYTLGSPAETARTELINDFNWSITDGGGI